MFCSNLKLNGCVYICDVGPLILHRIMLAREEQRFSIIFLNNWVYSINYKNINLNINGPQLINEQQDILRYRLHL
jgi:hypothetical protein